MLLKKNFIQKTPEKNKTAQKILPITAKMKILILYPKNEFSIPHQYKAPTDLKFLPDLTDKWRFLLHVVLGSLSEVRTNNVIKCVNKHCKTPKK